LNGKFQINADWFPSENAKMLYVWESTKGIARKMIGNRYRPDSIDPFFSADEMIEYFHPILTDHHEAQYAREKYKSMTLERDPDNDGKPYPSYRFFRVAFQQAAQQANIPKDT
jgi:hypothetical protein